MSIELRNHVPTPMIRPIEQDLYQGHIMRSRSENIHQAVPCEQEVIVDDPDICVAYDSRSHLQTKRHPSAFGIKRIREAKSYSDTGTVRWDVVFPLHGVFEKCDNERRFWRLKHEST